MLRKAAISAVKTCIGQEQPQRLPLGGGSFSGVLSDGSSDGALAGVGLGGALAGVGLGGVLAAGTFGGALAAGTFGGLGGGTSALELIGSY